MNEEPQNRKKLQSKLVEGALMIVKIAVVQDGMDKIKERYGKEAK